MGLLSCIGDTLERALSALSPASPIDLIVGYREGAVEEALASLHPFSDLLHAYRQIPYLAIRCEGGDARWLMEGARLASAGRGHRGLAVRSVDLSHEMMTYARREHADSSSSQLWNLSRIGAPAAWRHATGEGVSVAVIDTGIDYTHQDLSARFGEVLGINIPFPDSPPFDDNGHGTHVAGTVAGSETGVAPGATLYAVKVLDAGGSGSEADVIAGLEWALEQGADIANLSLGSSGASHAFEDICRRAFDEGMLICAAAGNEGRGPSYPASFGESVIAVTAIDRMDEHAYFSNIYRTNDISAPGVGIYSCVPGGYDRLSGTSMATPHVSGALALASQLSQDSGLEEAMGGCAERLPWEGSDPYKDVFGKGLLRADLLVESLLGDGKLRRLLSRRRRSAGG